MAACPPIDAVELFDFDAAAELFSLPGRKISGQSIGYRRFQRAADAIRFAIEELPPKSLLNVCLEVEELRLDGRAIRRLYDGAAYPLVRRAAE